MEDIADDKDGYDIWLSALGICMCLCVVDAERSIYISRRTGESLSDRVGLSSSGKTTVTTKVAGCQRMRSVCVCVCVYIVSDRVAGKCFHGDMIGQGKRFRGLFCLRVCRRTQSGDAVWRCSLETMTIDR